MLTEEKKKEMLAMAKGLLPTGYAIVPIEPTHQQIEAVTHGVVHKENGGLEWGIAAAYRAMIAVAMKPE